MTIWRKNTAILNRFLLYFYGDFGPGLWIVRCPKNIPPIGRRIDQIRLSSTPHTDGLPCFLEIMFHSRIGYMSNFWEVCNERQCHRIHALKGCPEILFHSHICHMRNIHFLTHPLNPSRSHDEPLYVRKHFRGYNPRSERAIPSAQNHPIWGDSEHSESPHMG